MKTNISTEYIKNIIFNSSNFQYWDSELNQYGEPDLTGSFEFETSDSTGRLWGGRFIKTDSGFELVEFFSKIFYSDMSLDQLEMIEPLTPEEIKNQPFNEFSDL